MTGAIQGPDGLHVTFGPDGHQAVFTRSWLAGHATAQVDTRCEDAKRLWSARDFPAGPPATSWQAYLSSEVVRLGCLRGLLISGFMLLTDVPAVRCAVTEVAATFGYLRETSRGRVFVAGAEPTPSGLASTRLPVGPHTDGPYRDPVPTLQLLHCLGADPARADPAGADPAGAGGETGLLDGFRAAAQLRAEDPGAFECLTRTPVTWAYADATTQLRAIRPMITLDSAGLIREVRYDGAAMQPMRPRTGAIPSEAAEQMREFYLAYRAFAAILLRPYLTLQLRLAAGDCLVVDNTRILRSRAASAAPRLQSCYADLDGAESTAAVLARRAGRKVW